MLLLWLCHSDGKASTQLCYLNLQSLLAISHTQLHNNTINSNQKLLPLNKNTQVDRRQDNNGPQPPGLIVTESKPMTYITEQ